jgi:hypothetical protein
MSLDTPTFLGPESTGDLYLKINKVTFDLEIEVTEKAASFQFAGIRQAGSSRNLFPKRMELHRPRQAILLTSLHDDLTCGQQAVTAAKSPFHLTPLSRF